MHKSYSSVVLYAVYDTKVGYDLFVFVFGLARGVVKKHQISELRACLRDQISLFVKIINGLRFRSVFAVKFEQIRLKKVDVIYVFIYERDEARAVSAVFFTQKALHKI